MEELRPPSVELTQVFTASSPSVVTPMLMACSVGPCWSIVEALTDDGAVNTSASSTLPAMAVSSTAGPFVGLGGKSISLQYKGYSAVDIDFPALPADPTTAQVVEVVNNTAVLTGLAARAIPSAGVELLAILSTADGDDEYFDFALPAGTDGTSLLGFPIGYKFYGHTGYAGDVVGIADVDFPDPDGILTQSTIDRSSVRVFVHTSGVNLVEARRDESVLRADDTAVIVGTVDLTGLNYPDDLMDKTCELTLTGQSEKTAVYFQTLRAEIIAAVNEAAAGYTAHYPDTAPASDFHAADDSTNALTVVFPLATDSTLVQLLAGWNDIVAMYDAHDANTGGVYHTGGSGHLTGLPPATTWELVISQHATFKTAYNSHIADGVGGGPGYHTGLDAPDLLNALAATLANVTQVEVLAETNAVWPTLASLQAATNYLLLTSSSGSIVVGNGSANSVVGLVDDDREFVLEAVDDGDGDNLTPYVRVDEADFAAASTAAVVTGTADITALTYPDDILGLTLIVGDDQHAQTIVLREQFKRQAATLLTEIGQGFAAHQASTTYHYAADGVNLMATTSITESATLAVFLAYVNDAQIQADAHDADAVPTWHGIAGGAHATVAPPATDWATLVALADDIKAKLNAHMADIGGAPQFHQQADIANPVTAADLVAGDQTTLIADVNTIMGAGFASLAGTSLRLTSAYTGYESRVVVGAGTANTNLGLTAGAAVGQPFRPIAGDELWANAAKVGTVVAISPGGHADRLMLDVEVPTGLETTNCWMVAKAIPAGAAGRPTPDLTGNTYQFVVKHDLLRDGYGQPTVGSGRLIITYNALRLDVTVNADDPSLLVFDNLDAVVTDLGTPSADNPLALACYFALANSPSSSVSALGVGATSADYPQGTPAAYMSALDYLEGWDVYTLAPLTHESAVHQLFAAHVLAMAKPENKKERITVISPAMPARRLSAYVVSGTDGESTAVVDTFDTKLADLGGLLTAAGLNPAALSADDGVYLDVAADDRRHNIASVTGTVVTLRKVFAVGENADGYFTVVSLSAALLQESFSVKIKGATISTKLAQAQTVNTLGRSYASRRVLMCWPPELVGPVDGTSAIVPGYYLAAALAGLIGQKNPATPISNMPVTGFTATNYSQGYFKDSLLNHMAAGGTFIVHQTSASGPTVVRHQLTTDVSTIKTRELNVTTAVDFGAKFFRLATRQFPGRHNITPTTLDTLATIVQSSAGILVNAGVFTSAVPGKPTVDADQQDRIVIPVVVTVKIPGNYVAITMLI